MRTTGLPGWLALAALGAPVGCGGETKSSSGELSGTGGIPYTDGSVETGGIPGAGGAAPGSGGAASRGGTSGSGGRSAEGGSPGTAGSSNAGAGAPSHEGGGAPIPTIDGGSRVDGGNPVDGGSTIDGGSPVDATSDVLDATSDVLDATSDVLDATSDGCVGPLTELRYAPIAHEYLVARTNTTVAQTFTTLAAMTLGSVSLQLWTCKSNGLVDARLTVVEVRTDGVPDWTRPLGSATVGSADLKDSCVAGDVFETELFVFSGIPLNAGTTYALVLEAIGSRSGVIYWRRSSTPLDPTDPYAGGTAFGQFLLGPSPYTHLDLDFLIQGRGPC